MSLVRRQAYVSRGLLCDEKYVLAAALQRNRVDSDPSSGELALAQEAKQNMVSLALCHAPNVSSLVRAVHINCELPSHLSSLLTTSFCSIY